MAEDLERLIKKYFMKKIIIIAAITISFISCDSNNKNTHSTASDSTILNASPSSGADTLQHSQGATGTTGTGTVSDSGNASNPGSDTANKNK